MGKHHFNIHIQRVDPKRNMARFYRLSLSETLFGGVSVIRSWGRVGTRGREIVHLFDSEAEALGLFLALARRKRARGYRVARGGG
jgi:predicted DNA-binding WGR domain protein